MKTYLTAKLKYVKVIKVIIASFLVSMIIIDIVLVALCEKGYPSYSWVVRDHRPHLLWLTFLYGGLVSKIFFNRQVNLKESEFSGFLTFLCAATMVLAISQYLLLSTKVSVVVQLIVLLSGGLLAYRAWPQYVHKNDQLSEKEMPVTSVVQK